MRVTQSQKPELGRQHSYSLKPPQPEGCKVTWFINGQEVTVGSEVGGLRVHGLNGTITVTAFAEIEGTVVSAKVKCGNEELKT